MLTKTKTPSPSSTNVGDLIAQDIKRVADSLKKAPCDMRFTEYLGTGGKYTIGHHSLLSYLGGYRKLVNAYFPPTFSPSAKVTLDEVKSIHREAIKSIGSYEIFLEELDKILEKMPPIKVTPYSFGKHIRTSRGLGLVVSDLHVGHNIDPEETNHAYGILEEARTVAHIVRTTCEYKEKHRDETELHLFLLGDLIENILHGATSSELLHIQTCRAMWLLGQMIGQFARNFKVVHVYCAVGNHDRDTALHVKRATHQKYNSLGTTIYYGIHQSVRNIPNVKWHQPKTPWIDTTILGHRVYATHGDTNFSIGNVGKTINTSIIENKMNRINSSLRDNQEYEVFITAHVHTGLFMKMNNGCNLVVNGGGLPPDAYVNTLDIMESPQCQALFEITPRYAVGDARFIDMDGVFKDKSLDKIIIPFKGLEY